MLITTGDITNAVTVGNSSLPVTVDVVKDQLRLTHSEFDSQVQSAIMFAAAFLEEQMALCFLQKTYQAKYTEWPTSAMELPIKPVSSVTSVTYLGTDGEEATFSSDDYHTDLSRHPSQIVLANGSTFPSLMVGHPRPITVEYVAGYASADDIPETEKDAIIQLAVHRYQNPQSVETRQQYMIPMALEMVVRHLKWRHH